MEELQNVRNAEKKELKYGQMQTEREKMKLIEKIIKTFAGKNIMKNGEKKILNILENITNKTVKYVLNAIEDFGEIILKDMKIGKFIKELGQKEFLKI